MKNKWFQYCSQEDNARVNLICFHHAGGSARFYIPWKAKLAPHIRVLPVQLPFRENRIKEPLGNTIQSMVEELILEQDSFLQSPFAFFGHSFGSFFAYEAAVYCQKQLGKQPLALFVSGTLAPDDAAVRREFLHLNEKSTVRRLINFEGTEERILESKLYLKYLMPVIQADFKLFGSYKGSLEKVNCPLFAYYGTEDGFVIQNQINHWRDFTADVFACRSFDGGHFYMNHHLEELCNDIERKLMICYIKNS